MPDENSLLTHEDIVLAGVVSKSDSLTLQHHIIFHRQAQFLALVDKIHLDATARREGAGK